MLTGETVLFLPVDSHISAKEPELVANHIASLINQSSLLRMLCTQLRAQSTLQLSPMALAWRLQRFIVNVRHG